MIKYHKNQTIKLKKKPLGIILQEADLVSKAQVEVGLQDQSYHPHMRLGEILVMRGWLKSQTADFFARDWFEFIQNRKKQYLGYYLQKSALLEPKDIEAILEEQKLNKIRFGSAAVLQGLIKQTTLDFFLMYLFPNEVGASYFSSRNNFVHHRHPLTSQRIVALSDYRQNSDSKSLELQEDKIEPRENHIDDTEEFEIKWID